VDETERLLNRIWNKNQVSRFVKEVYAGLSGCKEKIRFRPC